MVAGGCALSDVARHSLTRRANQGHKYMVAQCKSAIALLRNGPFGGVAARRGRVLKKPGTVQCSTGPIPVSAVHSAIGPESHSHRRPSEPETHQRPASPDRHALAPRVHRLCRDQIAIARPSPPAPHLLWVPSLEAFGRRPRASRVVAIGRHPKPFTKAEVVRFGVATLIHDVGTSPQSHIGRPE